IGWWTTQKSLLHLRAGRLCSSAQVQRFQQASAEHIPVTVWAFPEKTCAFSPSCYRFLRISNLMDPCLTPSRQLKRIEKQQQTNNIGFGFVVAALGATCLIVRSSYQKSPAKQSGAACRCL
ncbi:hypothetical protein TNCV_1509311, partial [Trichonephila clavipes]